MDLKSQLFSSEKRVSNIANSSDEFVGNIETIAITGISTECSLGFWEAGSPKFMWRCPQGLVAGKIARIHAEYSDKEADIQSLTYRVITTRIGHLGKTEGDWKTIQVNMNNQCGKAILPPIRIPLELIGKRFRFEVEGYLTDTQGHKSNTESCVLVDTL